MVVKEYQPLSLNSTAIKLKVFRFRDLDKVEQDINEWMSQKKLIIRHVTQSQSEKQGWFEFVVCVFYEDPDAGRHSS